MKILWFSGGCSSFVSAYLMNDEIDRLIYCHIDDQHEDTLRYLNDCEKILKRKIETIQSKRYKCVDDVQRAVRYINGSAGAPCTNHLKRQVRKIWESEQTEPLTYIWGLDSSEQNRADHLIDMNPNQEHEFPLITYGLNKQDVHGINYKTGIKRPHMYELGYKNNNCIGCVKGGMWYWNMIRRDFPEVFKLRAERERDIGATCLKDKNGKIYLDELDSQRGKKEDEISTQCGIMCELNI